MPTLTAFRGLRYDLGHVGALQSVVCPRREAISPELQNELYKRHPANAVRLIHNRCEPGDEPNSEFKRAGRFLRNWQREGVLRLDPTPAIYVYHQRYELGESIFQRQSIIGLLGANSSTEAEIAIANSMENNAEHDRILQATHADLSPIVGLYSDPINELQELANASMDSSALVSAMDDLGTEHRLWSITNIQAIQEIEALVASRSVTLTDGVPHWKAVTAAHSDPASSDKSKVMACLTAAEDRGLMIEPIHWIYRSSQSITADECSQRLASAFEIELTEQGWTATGQIWSRIENADDQHLLAFYTVADDRWVIARLNQPSDSPLPKDGQSQNAGPPKTAIDLLRRLVPNRLAPWAGTSEFTTSLNGLSFADSKQTTRDDIQLVVLSAPLSLDEIQRRAAQNQPLPTDRSGIGPNILSGLVFHAR